MYARKQPLLLCILYGEDHREEIQRVRTDGQLAGGRGGESVDLMRKAVVSLRHALWAGPKHCRGGVGGEKG